MNILQINTTDRRGGAAQIAWYIKEWCERLGWQSSMFVADKLSSGRSIFQIKRSKVEKLLSVLFSKDFYNNQSILDSPQYNSANLIHFHNLHGRYFNLNNLILMSRAKPAIWTLHDEWAISDHAVYTWQNETITDGFFTCDDPKMPERSLFDNSAKLARRKKIIYSKSQLHVVVPSLWLKHRVEKSALGKQKIHLIYNGIDKDLFRPVAKKDARQKLGLPFDKKIILCLSDGGKDSPRWKGWSYTKEIIHKYKANKDIIFLCVGNDAQQADTENIKYFGLIKQSELAEFYSAADVYLHTSLADNFPLVILEAMACGLPVVSFNVGGVGEAVIHKVTGYVAGYKDINDLVNGIEYIFRLNQDQIDVIRNSSIKRVEDHFTLEKMCTQYINLYKQVCESLQ